MIALERSELMDGSEDSKFNLMVPVLSEVPAKANPAIPDSVWKKFQELGDYATQHLERILKDPRFPALSIREQMRVLDTAFARAYGSTDGAVRRNLHVHVKEEETKGFNALRALSKQAGKQLPEFQKHSIPTGRAELLEDFEGDDDAVFEFTRNADAAKDISGDRD